MFKCEMFYNPFCNMIDATRENSKKTKKEVYHFQYVFQTCELQLQSYEYFIRDNNGYWVVSKGWYRYPPKAKKGLEFIDKKEVPRPDELSSEVRKFFASKIKFAPFNGTKAIETKRKEEETRERHWQEVHAKEKAAREEAAKKAAKLKKKNKEKSKSKSPKRKK